ncbi:MAG: sigma-70 family RNA polymerase sigma factor [Actinomycetota bacterium]
MGNQDRGERLASAVEAVGDGDASGWSELHELLHGTAIAVARRDMRMQPAEADDVAQEMWLKLLTRLSQVEEPRALTGWVRTTVRRECLRRKRCVGAGREVPTERLVDEHSTLADPEGAAIRSEERASVRRAVRRLPDQRRRLVELLAADELDYAGIAVAMDMPRGSIGPTRGRVLDGLRNEPELVALR